MKSKAFADRMLEKYTAELEGEYRRERAGRAEALYNAVAEAIQEQEANLETVLYVLELVRYSLISGRYASLFPKPGAAGATLLEVGENGVEEATPRGR